MTSKNIYLIGMPAAGKTTLGKQLAEKTGRDHRDLDDIIEEDMGMTVPQIFKGFGENKFRVAEQRALQKVAGWENTVISTGGGTPCFFRNIRLMNESGISVFLNVPVEELYKRVLNDARVRPLLNERPQLMETLQKTLLKRKTFYDQATYIISGPAISLENVLQDIDGIEM